MSVSPEDVTRVTPPRFFSLQSLLYNRDKLAEDAEGKLKDQDLTYLEGRGLCRQWTLLAGMPVDHGTVTDKAAMLALHVDSAETPTPRWVFPGDSVLRADDPGWRWHCIAGHGQSLSDWERRPITGHAHAIADVSGLSAALAAKLAASAASTAGLALLGVGTPAAVRQIPALDTDGTCTLIDVPDGSVAGAVVLLAEGELASSQAAISITSIPGRHRHLRLELSLRGTTSTTSVTMLVRCNGDTTAANYRGSRAAIQGGTFYHAQNSGGTASIIYSCEVTDSAALANSFTGYEITFWDYAAAKLKTARNHGGYVQGTAAGNYLIYDAIGAWLSIAAITQLDISLAAGSLAAGSSWRLYGLG